MHYISFSVPLQLIIGNSLNMQGANCLATFVRFQKEAVVGVVVEEILCQGGAANGILPDVEVAFPVGIFIGVAFRIQLKGGRRKRNWN